MAIKSIKIKFTRDYSPRKKGEYFEAETLDEIRLAEWYLANQIAERCGCGVSNTGCAGCNEKIDEKESSLEPKAKKTRSKKVSTDE